MDAADLFNMSNDCQSQSGPELDLPPEERSNQESSNDEMSDSQDVNTDSAIEAAVQRSHKSVGYICESINDEEWESSVLLSLKEKFFCPFAALEFVSSSMREFYQRKKKELRVHLFKKYNL